MATQTTKGTGIAKENFMVVLGGGNVTNTGTITNSTLINNTFKSYNWGVPVPNPLSGIQPGKLGSGVAITAITQSGSTGYVNIQKSSHGLALGAIIKVYSADVAGYNVTHMVTEVTDANNVKTNVRYTANTSSAHGSYKPLSGLFNAMTANCYVATIVGKDTAGAAIAHLVSPGADSARRPIAFARGNQRYHITSWDYVSGAATKGGSAGNTVTYINPVGGGAVTEETVPTRSIPGEFVYTIGTNLPTMADYKARTA